MMLYFNSLLFIPGDLYSTANNGPKILIAIARLAIPPLAPALSPHFRLGIEIQPKQVVLCCLPALA